MRILMLSWEYPPNIIGGIARHVDELSKFLAKKNVEVTIITPEVSGAPLYEVKDNIRIFRVPIQIPAPNFYTWIFILNHFFSKKIAQLTREDKTFDIIHAHDWMTVPCSSEAKLYTGSNFILTFHSLEFKRSQGSQTLESRMIESIEWWGSYDAQKIIVCSDSMKKDVIGRFNVPEEKLVIIPNGIDTTRLNITVNTSETRRKYNVFWKETMILFVGRLTPQKGCEYLIRAMPHILGKYNAKLVIVGDGPSRGFLESEVNRLGLSDRVIFTGFLPDDEMIKLLKSTDVLVVPSIYEPFGIVALEGMAAGVPVIASDVDGLSEIIEHGVNGIKVFPRDPYSIYWGIDTILSNPSLAESIKRKARESINKRFSWEAIAEKTIEVYKKVCDKI
ncbi:MAG: glycosyltransferase family 4 protein [Nitrososphaeria archaeon]|nr:glycosyltransferase family 4 protein [Nitrososphaeria archaeon]